MWHTVLPLTKFTFVLSRLFHHKLTLVLFSILLGLGIFLYHVDGPHKEQMQAAEKYLLWCLWWVGLGVLSSVGLGTGLHTFILYLGPHIAGLCNSLLVAHGIGVKEGVLTIMLE